MKEKGLSRVFEILEQCPVFQAFGTKKQAVFFDVFLSSVDISNISHIHGHDCLH